MNIYDYTNNNRTHLKDIIQILTSKVADPYVGTKKTLKILKIFKRQIDFCTRNYRGNWWDEFQVIDNEMRALVLSEDEE